jgi:hypothetical protein
MEDDMDILSLARKQNPEIRYALSESGNVLGKWHDGIGFLPSYGLSLDGKWYPMNPVRINGKPIVEKWIE